VPFICFLARPVRICNTNKRGKRRGSSYAGASLRKRTSSSRLLLRRQGTCCGTISKRRCFLFPSTMRHSPNDLRRIRSVEDLRHLPFTIKRACRKIRSILSLVPDRKFCPASLDHPALAAAGTPCVEESVRSASFAHRSDLYHGRAAQPLAFLYTDHDVRRLQDAGGRMMRIGGVKRT